MENDFPRRNIRSRARLRTNVYTALLALLVSACSVAQQRPNVVGNSALIIDGGTIFGTASPQSVVIRGAEIAFVGSAAEAASREPAARHIDIAGSTILPGLVDAHGHLGGLGASFDNVALVGTNSIDAVRAAVAARASQLPAGEWVLGRGWDQNDWPVQAFPTAADLDAAFPDHPVALERVDGHALWVNTRALQLAGITASTPDPAGGKIIRDAAGNPTGVFIDTAAGLVESKIPAPSRERRRAQLLAAMKNAASLGLTGVHDAGMDDEAISILRELADSGEMPIRVYVMLADNAALLQKWFSQQPLVNYKGLLTVRAVKMYADGALGSRGAALLQPYSDDPDNSGLMIATPEHIRDVAARAKASGYQVNTHAIGDRAVRVTLESYAAAGVTPDDRFRIEHFQVAHPDDIKRTAAMGVIASMQPVHATSDMYWAEKRVGSERIKGAYAWQSVLRNGGRLACGSDFPVEEVNPFHGIHAAVHRQDLKRWPAGGWMPQERLSLEQAIDGFTSGAAYAAFEENIRGEVEVGRAADLTIVDRLDPQNLDKTKVRYTIVGGRIVHSE